MCAKFPALDTHSSTRAPTVSISHRPNTYPVRPLNNRPLPAFSFHQHRPATPIISQKGTSPTQSPHSPPPSPYSSHTLVNVFMEPLPCCIPYSLLLNIQTTFPLSLSLPFIFVSSQSAHKIIDRPLSYPPCFHPLHHNSRLKNRKRAGIPDVLFL